MTMPMIATLTNSLLMGTPSSAVSSEAQYINEQVDENWNRLQQTRTFGQSDLFNDLNELAEQCARADWDGYGAAAVDPETILEADQFLRSLSLAIHQPTLGAEPDGHVTFEWYESPKRTLSVSLGSDGMIHYSALIGSTRHFGTEPFLGECPETILTLIQLVHQS